jgi:hypothetical protein
LEGTQTTILGGEMAASWYLDEKCRNIRSSIHQSHFANAIFGGRCHDISVIATNLRLASIPTARIAPVSWLITLTLGSLRTIPSLDVDQSVLRSRSTAMS